MSFTTLEQSAPNFAKKSVYVGGTAYNWFPAWREIPKTTKPDGRPSLPARTAGYRFTSENEADMVFALLCSCLGYWWWAVASDGFNLKKWLLDRFPLTPDFLPPEKQGQLGLLGAKMRSALKKQYVFKSNVGIVGNFFLPGCAHEAGEIDQFLADSLPDSSQLLIDDIRGFNSVFSRNLNDGNDVDEE